MFPRLLRYIFGIYRLFYNVGGGSICASFFRGKLDLDIYTNVCSLQFSSWVMLAGGLQVNFLQESIVYFPVAACFKTVILPYPSKLCSGANHSTTLQINNQKKVFIVFNYKIFIYNN